MKKGRPARYNIASMTDPKLLHAPLGHDVAYPRSYDPGLLFPIERQASRASLPQPLPAWHGADIWNAYEISWLDPRGKPAAAAASFVFAQHSPRIVESKSFKLYLNSYNESRHESAAQVRDLMQRDLEHACGAPVEVRIHALDMPGGAGRAEAIGTDAAEAPADGPCAAPRPLPGRNIDALDLDIAHYTPAPELLRLAADATRVEETLVSDLLKTNCPVTGQPDWGSVQIRYAGARIDPAALLAYIVSLRHHNEFHEHCVERMYCDIWRACRPEALFVYARYTRRGGLDINPWRASHPARVDNIRTVRQ
ncbi:NADPH-dependent 7-cyano-7-deazaguanine reductase QueF [Candidimonas humi]|uniref:NADPH-dependent 7-cyano-7-deazaguanine reductase n=1 Tax=Candidimonas humi TaxID=683355 RepID=A0ABV8NTX2_9BURK